jgi:hypothetical protein
VNAWVICIGGVGLRWVMVVMTFGTKGYNLILEGFVDFVKTGGGRSRQKGE